MVPILGPGQLVVITSFVTSPPASVTVLSAKCSSVSGVSLSAKQEKVSAATTPERVASDFFSMLLVLLVYSTIVTGRLGLMRYALFGDLSCFALGDGRQLILIDVGDFRDDLTGLYIGISFDSAR